MAPLATDAGDCDGTVWPSCVPRRGCRCGAVAFDPATEFDRYGWCFWCFPLRDDCWDERARGEHRRKVLLLGGKPRHLWSEIERRRPRISLLTDCDAEACR
jgi:hypothetical protein